MKTLQTLLRSPARRTAEVGTLAREDKLGVLWAQYGPYHFARFAALARMAGPKQVFALELANLSRDYAWSRTAGASDLLTICPGTRTEDLPFKLVFQQTRRKLAELGIQTCLLPSYSPRQSAAALLAAKSLGIKTVMMNESHAGTARATGASAFAKRRLVRLFDAALVGGRPHRRYFASLGMSEEKIFTGYNAVDNDYFARRAAEVRARSNEIRARYQLPAHFFLNLGRFVAKKNLPTLIWAYRIFLDASALKRTHLVLVGAGEEEANLRNLAQELHVPVYDKAALHRQAPPTGDASREQNAEPSGELPPGIHFYGFRQIDENPAFYGLADGFVLPSLSEEWGLVVNEAMASGLPVVVSETAGCAEDLLEPGWPAVSESSASELHPWLGKIKGAIRRNGFLFKPTSAEALAGALLALEAMPQLRRAMGQASRELVEKFSCENFARNALRAARAAQAAAEPQPSEQNDLVEVP